MALKLNINRTTKITVPLVIDDGDGDCIQTFTAECKVLKHDLAANADSKARLIDTLLVSVEGLELVSEKGKPLTKEKTLAAVKNDPELEVAIIQAWRLGNEARLMKGRTFLEQSESS